MFKNIEMAIKNVLFRGIFPSKFNIEHVNSSKHEFFSTYVYTRLANAGWLGIVYEWISRKKYAS